MKKELCRRQKKRPREEERELLDITKLNPELRTEFWKILETLADKGHGASLVECDPRNSTITVTPLPASNPKYICETQAGNPEQLFLLMNDCKNQELHVFDDIDGLFTFVAWDDEILDDFQRGSEVFQSLQPNGSSIK